MERSMIRTPILTAIAAVFLVAAGEVSRADTPTSQPAATQAVAESATDRILDALDRRGKTLHSFTADVKMALTDNLGSGSTYVGTVVFQSIDPTDARIHATFTQRIEDGKIFPDRLEC